jgi:hypothetical protein
MSMTVKEAAAKVCEGFDKGIFVRDISKDPDAGWASHVLFTIAPYLVALGVLRRFADD